MAKSQRIRLSNIPFDRLGQEVMAAWGREISQDLRDNIEREGGNPETGEKWKELAQSTIDRKRRLGLLLGILRETDKMRKSIRLIRTQKSGNLVKAEIGVTGSAQKYSIYHEEERPFLGVSPTMKERGVEIFRALLRVQLAKTGR